MDLRAYWLVWFDREGADQGLPWLIRSPTGARYRASSVLFEDGPVSLLYQREGFQAEGVGARGIMATLKKPIFDSFPRSSE